MNENQRGKSSYGKRKSTYRGGDQPKRKSKYNLETGLKGFICTCNFNEKHCIREAYNILNEYSESEEKNKPTLPVESEEEEDVNDALTKEVEALKKESSRENMYRKFQVVETGSNNCLFIRTTVPDPVSLVNRILEDIKVKKQRKTRFLLRMLPIETTCKAYMKSMEEAFKPLVEKHFSSEGKTFSIIYRARCNNSSSREEVIELLAGMVKTAHPDNRADLNNPQLAVLVEIIKGICCIGVVPRFNEYRKYNLLELASPSLKEKTEDITECSVSATDEKCKVEKEMDEAVEELASPSLKKKTEDITECSVSATDEKCEVDKRMDAAVGETSNGNKDE